MFVRGRGAGEDRLLGVHLALAYIIVVVYVCSMFRLYLEVESMLVGADSAPLPWKTLSLRSYYY